MRQREAGRGEGGREGGKEGGREGERGRERERERERERVDRCMRRRRGLDGLFILTVSVFATGETSHNTCWS